jgi:arginine-tRNA-protein transferase
VTEARNSVRLYRTAAHGCGYYADRLSTNQVLDPESPHLAAIFGQALAHGFRRAGDIVYRPDCAACAACVPYRVALASFAPNRAQRRVLVRNSDVVVSWRPAEASDEHYQLYLRYLGHRHADGGMDHATAEDYRRFLFSRWARTALMELRLGGDLIGAAVTDLVPDGASAVYTYFAPEHAQRSLGTFAILQQLDYCRREALAHLYLGYWIDGHPKMNYKRQFGPGEVCRNGAWQGLDAPTT